MPVHPGTSLVRIARWKMPFPIRIAPRIQLLYSSQRMLYYSRYATERKDAVLEVPLLQLITSKPLACCFSKTLLTWALPYSFQVMATRPDLACVSPTSIGYTTWFLLSSSYIPEILQGVLLLPLSQHGCWYPPPCTHPFPFSPWVELFLSTHWSSLPEQLLHRREMSSFDIGIGAREHVYLCVSLVERRSASFQN
jgi:hypothetical protein